MGFGVEKRTSVWLAPVSTLRDERRLGRTHGQGEIEVDPRGEADVRGLVLRGVPDADAAVVEAGQSEGDCRAASIPPADRLKPCRVISHVHCIQGGRRAGAHRERAAPELDGGGEAHFAVELSRGAESLQGLGPGPAGHRRHEANEEQPGEERPAHRYRTGGGVLC